MKVIKVVVAAVLAISVAAFLVVMTARPRHGVPVRHHVSSSRQRELAIARDRLTAGDIDAERYERIVDALRR